MILPQPRYGLFQKLCTIILIFPYLSLSNGKVILPSIYTTVTTDEIPKMREYDSLEAKFGGEIEFAKRYHANLYLPPLAMNEAGNITDYHYLCNVPPLSDIEGSYTRLDNVQTLTQIVTDNKDTDNSQKNSTRPDRKPEERISKAILVKRGKCTFETKALVTMQLNAQYLESMKSSGGEGINIDQSELIEFVLVYDNLPERKSKLTVMELPGENYDSQINIKLLFLNSQAGNELTRILHDRYYYNESNHGNQMDEGLPVVISSENNADKDAHRSGGWLSQGNYNAISWLRFVLCIMLILFPIVRGILIWYSAGGRIRARTENGRITFFYIPPHPRWLAHAVGVQMVQEGDGEVSNKMSEEQVLALPEFIYGQEYSEEDESEIDPDTESMPKTSSFVPANCTSCSICLDDFEEGDRLRLLPCNHSFHTNCILPWLTERQDCCPLCKISVIGSNSASTEDVNNNTVTNSTRTSALETNDDDEVTPDISFTNRDPDERETNDLRNSNSQLQIRTL